MGKPTFEEIEEALEKAKRVDGAYDGVAISELNQRGVYFSFTPIGISWSYKPYTI